MPVPKPRLFLDTNVLVAGARSTTGASHVILRLSQWTIVEGIISQQVTTEAERVVQAKLPQALPALRLLIGEAVTIVDDPSPEELEDFEGQADTDDLPLLVAAVKNGCRYLLTFNTRDYYPNLETTDLEILPPGEFLHRMREQLAALAR